MPDCGRDLPLIVPESHARKGIIARFPPSKPCHRDLSLRSVPVCSSHGIYAARRTGLDRWIITQGSPIIDKIITPTHPVKAPSSPLFEVRYPLDLSQFPGQDRTVQEVCGVVSCQRLQEPDLVIAVSQKPSSHLDHPRVRGPARQSLYEKPLLIVRPPHPRSYQGSRNLRNSIPEPILHESLFCAHLQSKPNTLKPL